MGWFFVGMALIAVSIILVNILAYSDSYTGTFAIFMALVLLVSGIVLIANNHNSLPSTITKSTVTCHRVSTTQQRCDKTDVARDGTTTTYPGKLQPLPVGTVGP